MSKNNICNNCGKQGHQFYQCKLPITSYGVIVFRTSAEYGLQYLMIRRKNSFGYADFIRGKYMLNNVEHLQGLFDEMSIEEKEKIRTSTFGDLWNSMWWASGHNNSQYRVEEHASEKKFDMLKAGITDGDETISIDTLLERSKTNWTDTEWEFPKGKRNFQEKDLDCALREFEEETGIQSSSIKIVENLIPFEEMFLGSNHKSYKYKYFLGYTEFKSDDLNNYQQSEVSKLDWKTLDECLSCIRTYSLEKKRLITNINKVLQEYRLY